MSNRADLAFELGSIEYALCLQVSAALTKHKIEIEYYTHGVEFSTSQDLTEWVAIGFGETCVALSATGYQSFQWNFDITNPEFNPAAVIDLVVEKAIRIYTGQEPITFGL